MGGAALTPFSRARYTCPAVSHAPTTPRPPSAREKLLIGQAPIFHLPRTAERNVVPPSCETSRVVSRSNSRPPHGTGCKDARVIHEGAHGAAPALARGQHADPPLPREGLAAVRRAGHVNAPCRLVLALWRGVPGDVNVAAPVGGDGAAAVDLPSAGEQVPLRLERRARVIQAGVRDVESGVAVRRLRPDPVPGDMDAPVLAHGQLRAPDGADGDGAARRAVDADRRGERGVGPERLVDVEDVPVGGVAREIDQVQDACASTAAWGWMPPLGVRISVTASGAARRRAGQRVEAPSSPRNTRWNTTNPLDFQPIDVNAKPSETSTQSWDVRGANGLNGRNAWSRTRSRLYQGSRGLSKSLSRDRGRRFLEAPASARRLRNRTQRVAIENVI